MTPSLGRRIGDNVLAGLLALLPLGATWLALRFAFGLARDASLWTLQLLLSVDGFRELLTAVGIPFEPGLRGVEALPPAGELLVSLLAVVLTLAALFAVGWLSRRVVGRRLLRGVNHTLSGLPGLGLVYRAVAKLVEAIEGDASPAFDAPVRVPFLQGADSLGFVTRRGSTHSAVFVPTAPNPTTGFLLMVPNGSLQPVDFDASEALSAVLSAGVLLDVDAAFARGAGTEEVPPE